MEFQAPNMKGLCSSSYTSASACPSGLTSQKLKLFLPQHASPSTPVQASLTQPHGISGPHAAASYEQT